MTEEKATEATKKGTHIELQHHDEEKDEHVDLTLDLVPEHINLDVKARLARDPDETGGVKGLFEQLGPLIARVGRQVTTTGPWTSADGAVPYRVAKPAADEPAEPAPGKQATEAQLLVQDIVGGIVPLDDLPPGTLGDIERILRSKTDQLKRLVEIFEDDPAEPSSS
jgi:hypothetical protein